MVVGQLAGDTILCFVSCAWFLTPSMTRREDASSIGLDSYVVWCWNYANALRDFIAQISRHDIVDFCIRIIHENSPIFVFNLGIFYWVLKKEGKGKGSRLWGSEEDDGGKWWEVRKNYIEGKEERRQRDEEKEEGMTAKWAVFFAK